MFERRREYPCAITDPGPNQDEALRLAMSWARDLTPQGSKILLHIPLRATLNNSEALARISRASDVAVKTAREGLYSTGEGAAVSVWPVAEDLDKLIDGIGHSAAGLCVVPWSESETDLWARVFQPSPLGTASPPGQAPIIQDPVVRRALSSININHNNVLAGYEKDEALEPLMILHDGGHQLDAEGLHAWALSTGWKAETAREFAEYARKIAGGKRPRLRERHLLPNALENWRDEAQAA